ncbi:MAG TPA: cysteine desulfurase family protein [Polyangiaceae bacterium]|jgi:cysteine desulfurase|nr:cysteine desulfurase family protein [Polyangiaceae bacterium]
MQRAYLDWNATAPPHASVREAMSEAARDAWGNPSSVHAEGRAARRWVERAREAVATLTGKDARDVLFTSGGTEANNLAIVSAMERPGKLLVSRIEHPSVTRVAEKYEREGRVRWLEVLPSGAIDLDDLRAALESENVSTLAVCAVSAEMGIAQPLDSAIGLAQARGVWVHVDAVQAFGRVQSASILARRADTVSLAAHKMRGPKGIGALAALPGARIVPVIVGGAQERGLRPGTVDAVACAGLFAAVSRAEESAAAYARLAPLRDRLEAALIERGAERNGDPLIRAPHIASLAFPGFSGPELVAALDLEGVAVSAGPACSAGTMEPSKSLTILYGEDRARRTIRISLGEETTSGEVDFALGVFREVLQRSART